MKRYFITGTDTDCGKTYVTRKLLEATPDSLAIKPVASGCSIVDGQLVSDDAVRLQISPRLSLNEINPWRFEPAVSPHIAAKAAGIRLSATELADFCLRFESPGCKTLFIEGAGGLMVPLNEEETWIDFLKISKIPVILVVGMRLGCINHALLTHSALQLHEIECAGWVANAIDPDMECYEENYRTLVARLGPDLRP